MSVGHLCKTCGEGRVRPFQFSVDQAVVRCDNADCDSYLEVPPWDCVIRQTITPYKKRQSVFSGPGVAVVVAPYQTSEAQWKVLGSPVTLGQIDHTIFCLGKTNVANQSPLMPAIPQRLRRNIGTQAALKRFSTSCVTLTWNLHCQRQGMKPHLYHLREIAGTWML
ncbi:hypothetical protein C7M84_009969 [Penaeus vannamei]|uniref:Uncharacterized protein n=1 Tax=Penaeus vannamei TaxID=6689 RepID=A0A423T5J8_PENVA|nr:hypothetical protein C7M84_009969 [Penaeus vannamei]